MQPSARPSTVLECKDCRSDFGFQYCLQQRKPDRLESGWNRATCLKDLGIPQLVQIPDLVKCVEGTVTTTPECKLHQFKCRLQPCSYTEEETVTDTSPAVQIFSCPEEGCMKVYQRFSSLQHHLDLGKHKCALEHETLRDRAALGYAERLQGQSGSVPQIEQVRKRLNLSNQPFYRWVGPLSLVT